MNEKQIEKIFKHVYEKKLDTLTARRKIRKLKAETGIPSQEIYRIRKRVWARVHSDFLSKYYKKRRAQDKVDFDFRPKNQKRRVAWTKSELSKFVELQDAGATAKEIAKKLKCSLASVGYHRRRYHLTERILGANKSKQSAFLDTLSKSEGVLERMAG